jgi:hypothetical protein
VKHIEDQVSRLDCDASDWTDDETRQQLARSAKENGWDEAATEAYDRYDEELVNRSGS